MSLRAALGGRARAFARALLAPEETQRRILLRILEANADTAFGRAHRFAEIGVEHYGKWVPVQDYEALAPYIERVRAGEPGVLTAEPVRALEPTSGSTGANKYIPITDTYTREMQGAVYPWLHDLCTQLPSLNRTRWYTAISPLGRTEQALPGGPPIGLESDAAWFGARVARLFGARLAVTGEVAAGDVESCRRRTAEALLACGTLGFISVWSPTFLEQLFDVIEREIDGLLRALHHKRPQRARSLARIFAQHGRLVPLSVWPHLALVSCWTEGPSAPFAARLSRRLGGVPLQGKGLLATEGAVSVPLWGEEGAPLAICSHFLEFLEADAPTKPALLAHELVLGGEYLPLLTTGAGLYRYPLADRVRVVGYTGATPRVVFLGRQDGTSDLCGEKLAPRRVEAVLAQVEEALGLRPAFALLAPELGAPPGYVLYIEGLSPADVEDFSRRVEALLAQGEHYAYCRALGQLGPVRGVSVRDGLRRYEQGAVARGQRAGTLKVTRLETRSGWSGLEGE